MEQYITEKRKLYLKVLNEERKYYKSDEIQDLINRLMRLTDYRSKHVCEDKVIKQILRQCEYTKDAMEEIRQIERKEMEEKRKKDDEWKELVKSISAQMMPDILSIIDLYFGGDLHVMDDEQKLNEIELIIGSRFKHMFVNSVTYGRSKFNSEPNIPEDYSIYCCHCFPIAIDKLKNNQLSKPDEQQMSTIRETIINILKSYAGNWVMNAFSKQRQEEVMNYLEHRYKSISSIDLMNILRSVLDEISQIDLKPFGE